jgi:SET domain-containing protein
MRCTAATHSDDNQFNPNCEADEENDRIYIKALRNIKAGEDYQLRLRLDH